MKIAITGGKGGTGKSMVATSLANYLAENHSVLLVDADVECPDDHLLIGIERKVVKAVWQFIPKFDLEICRKCGRCSQVCKEKAIFWMKGRYPIFFPELCIGCSACRLACPFGAIKEGRRKMGTIYSGKAKFDFLGGELEVGQEEAGPVVNELKNTAERLGTYDFILIDTAAGTHCNVISALLGCDLALAVAEPTPFGSHDLRLILGLCRVLDVPVKIVLNKAGIGSEDEIEKIAGEFKTEIITKIPFSKSILKAYSQGRPVRHPSIRRILKYL